MALSGINRLCEGKVHSTRVTVDAHCTVNLFVVTFSLLLAVYIANTSSVEKKLIPGLIRFDRHKQRLSSFGRLAQIIDHDSESDDLVAWEFRAYESLCAKTFLQVGGG